MSPDELAARLQAAPARLRVLIGRESRRSAATIETEAKLAVSGRVLRVRSGRLRASIAASVDQDAAGVTLRATAGGRGITGAPVVYAAAHEYGATIRPVRARMLAIPLAGARTAGGDARYASPLRQTAAGELRFERGRDGRMWLFPARGGAPLFRLVPQVTLPPRPFVGPAVRAEQPRLLARLGDGVRVALLGGDRG